LNELQSFFRRFSQERGHFVPDALHGNGPGKASPAVDIDQGGRVGQGADQGRLRETGSPGVLEDIDVFHPDLPREGAFQGERQGPGLHLRAHRTRVLIGVAVAVAVSLRVVMTRLRPMMVMMAVLAVMMVAAAAAAGTPGGRGVVDDDVHLLGGAHEISLCVSGSGRPKTWAVPLPPYFRAAGRIPKVFPGPVKYLPPLLGKFCTMWMREAEACPTGVAAGVHQARRLGVSGMELDLIQAIELAISHELEARKSYLRLAEEADDPELRRLLTEIAQEEAGHEASLRSRLRLYEQKQLLRETLSRYVSPAMCEELLKNPQLLQLGGQRRHLTVLFADIQGFTTLSEKMDPADVVAMLNRFFTEMVDLIFQHQGTLDKFMGDGLMAYFGAPLEMPAAATQAVACAVAMHRRLEDMRRESRTPITAIRVGVNTGEAILGNIGSDKRMDFTIIGDVVNVASRLLEVARQENAGIVISDATRREVERHFNLRTGPTLVLRGRQESTASFLVEVPPVR